MNWPNPWRQPSALRVAVRQLEEAQRDRLETTKNMEYYMAMTGMLGGRVERLQREVVRLSAEDLIKPRVTVGPEVQKPGDWIEP